jgi:hypothetical protein
MLREAPDQSGNRTALGEASLRVTERLWSGFSLTPDGLIGKVEVAAYWLQD